MGHSSENLKIIVNRQLYAYGSRSIKEIITFCQAKITPINEKLEKTESQLKDLEAEFNSASHAMRFTDMQDLKPKIEKLKQYRKNLDEKKGQWCYTASEGYYEDDGMISQGIEEAIMLYYKNQIVEPILDTPEKEKHFREYEKNRLQNDDNLWIKIGIIQFKFTTQGRKAYLNKSLPKMPYYS